MKREEAHTRCDPDLPQRFADRMGHLLGPEFPSDIALAVSGGSDSMAMLLLAHGWARHMGVRLWVVTVDHGLRPEAADEAAFVKTECAALGLAHTTLRWRWDGKGNLQAAAREARIDLIGRWAGAIRHVLFAHTQDDVAETFLMRLARGSGVEGLAAMAAIGDVPRSIGANDLPDADIDGPVPLRAETLHYGEAGRSINVTPPSLTRVRPLLEEPREGLRGYLRFHKTRWVEDPSNEDPAFDRVRVRAAMEGLGIPAQRLAGTARRMSRAREALFARAEAAARDVVSGWDGSGDVVFDRTRLASLEPETGLRLMAEAVRYVSSTPYKPRASALEDALARATDGGRMTLQGCLVTAEAEVLRVCREYAAVADMRVPFNSSPWDQRWWSLPKPEFEGLDIAALGEQGAAQLEGRPAGTPFYALIARPAVFDGARLVAFAPAGFGSPYSCKLNPPGGSFAAGWVPLKRRS